MSVFVILLFYLLTFFLLYLYGVVNLLSQTQLFTSYIVNIKGQENKIITANYDNFISEYDNVADGTADVITNDLKCVIDNNDVYYDFVRPDSPHWNIYLTLSIVTMSKYLLI